MFAFSYILDIFGLSIKTGTHWMMNSVLAIRIVAADAHSYLPGATGLKL